MAKKRKTKRGEKKHNFIHKGISKEVKAIRGSEENIQKEELNSNQTKNPDLARFIIIASTISISVAALYLLYTRTEIFSGVLQKLGIL